MTLDRLVNMATRKGLSLIYEIQNFANTYLGKVTKFQYDACSVSFTGLEVDPPGMNRVKPSSERWTCHKSHLFDHKSNRVKIFARNGILW